MKFPDMLRLPLVRNLSDLVFCMPKTIEPIRAFELTFILDEKATPESGQMKTAELKTAIEALGGSLTKEEHWGRRELAYPIKRNRSGLYVTLWLDLPSTKLKALDEQLRFDESIIRSLVTKAYTSAQPGTLYPLSEEEKKEKSNPVKEEKGSPEEMIRRRPANSSKKDEAVELEENVSEEERLKKLDETLKELLQDEE